MAYSQIPNLPAAISLNGTEEMEAVQAGTSVRVTTRQIADLITTYYGEFYDTTTQTNAGATVANAVQYNSTGISNGISIEALSKVRIAHAGIYNIMFSFQFDKTDAGDDEVEVWLSVNGTNVPNTGTLVSLHGNDGKAVAAWNFFYQFAANDYFQIFWNSVDLNLRILARAAQTNPARPAVPSTILTVNSL